MTRWKCPLDGFVMVPTMASQSFRDMRWWPQMQTGLPMIPQWDWPPEDHHPGAFGVARKHDVHTWIEIDWDGEGWYDVLGYERYDRYDGRVTEHCLTKVEKLLQLQKEKGREVADEMRRLREILKGQVSG